ncbi:MAG: serine--tRNA ligase [Rhodobacteraceae bacterium]|nr:serine--tRNA ligase [Paracoccaceae bacterium]
MHDIRMIRENPEAFDAGLARRGLSAMSSEILEIDGVRRAKIRAAEEALAERNSASKLVGAAKAKGDEAEFERLRALVGDKKAEIAKLEEESKAESSRLNELLMGIPNIPAEDTPDGATEDDNVEVKKHGALRNFAFDPKEHYEIAGAATGLNFELAAKLSGSRFVVLSGAMVRLHRALAQFMLDTHIDKNGLTEMWVPVLVRDEAMYGTGQLPKFAEDSYRTENGWWLIPTAEVPLTNVVAGEIVDEATLPRRMMAHTQCFRSEAGSAGRDTSGILRQHQFEKVEMVSITKPEDSAAELDRMVGCAEGILEALNIPYRTLVLCTGDTGFGMRQTFDIEAWLPGQNTYREISSCSVAGDFQARRMNARYRPEGGKPEFVHTLNGSGLAIGRTLIAVVENYQQEDGSIEIPTVLQAYMGGNTVITASGELA